MPIKAVLFDAVGTLLRPEPAVAEVYYRAGQRFGSKIGKEEIERRFAQSVAVRFFEDPPPAAGAASTEHRTNADWEVRRWKNIVGDVFPDVPDREGIFLHLWNHFAQPDSWRAYEDVHDCWNSLSSSGLIVGVASNFDDRLPAICRGVPPVDTCRHVFYSSMLGYRKPSRLFFTGIAAALGVRPNHLLLVGDDLDSDYTGAKAAGWNALLLDRNCTSTGCDHLHSLEELHTQLA